jgi:hypothetical protein
MKTVKKLFNNEKFNEEMFKFKNRKELEEYKSKYLKEFKKIHSNFKFDPEISNQTYMKTVKKLFNNEK